MKVTVGREELLKPLQMITGVVERRQTLPILANCLIDAGPDGVRFTGTDLEIEITGRLAEGRVDKPGTVTVSSWKLLEITRTLAEGSEVVLEADGEKLVLSSARSRFSLATLPARDFPGVDAVEGEVSFRIEPATLAGLMHKTGFAMAHQDVRYYLNGLLMELHQGKLRAVATDGHRLAYGEAAADITRDPAQQVIVPRKAVQELQRILREAGDLVTVRLDQNHLCVEGDDFRFVSKLIDGKFPDYQGVIPRHDKLNAEIDRDVFRQALTQAGKLVNEKYRGVRLEFSPDGLRVTANNPEQEQAEVEVQVTYDGPVQEIGFNVQYLLDILGVTEGESVKVWLADPNSSIRIEDEADPDACYVVMPMML